MPLALAARYQLTRELGLGLAFSLPQMIAPSATTVQEYLVNHGVDTGRMSSKGYGQDRPLASNDTDEGRTQNRRVEIHIEERK